MSNNIRYQYADGDLLNQPNNYSYTTYYGAAFIEAWQEQRDIIRDMPPTSHAICDNKNNGKTDLLLATIQASLSNNTINQNSYNDLLNLVKRFEVSKRLHANYNEAWKPVDLNDYHSPQRYLLFGEILEQIYAMTNFLAFLNCLLKVVDTISSLTAQLSNYELARVKILINKELAHVRLLSKRCEESASAT